LPPEKFRRMDHAGDQIDSVGGHKPIKDRPRSRVRCHSDAESKFQIAPPPMTAHASHCTTIVPAKWS
jgi:hypothetical protein